MLNQIQTTEANSSGIFLKNYLECVEDFPDDIMKIISICRELDVKTNNIVKEAENISEKIATATREKKSKMFTRLQQILIKLQDLNDEKIHFGQILAEMIETKFRTVDRDYQNNLNSKDRIQSPVPSSSQARKTSIEQQMLSVLPLRTSATGSNISSSSSSETNAGNDRNNAKRIRRTRTDLSEEIQIKSENVSKVLLGQSSNATKKAAAAANKKQKKTQKKAVVTKQNTQAIQEPIQSGIHDDVDPDEETYCLCGQISYGEMILCENDLCGIEWFHFSCVSLQSKPKGKWYCPNCRGDRPNVMNKNLRKKFQDSPNI